MPEEEDIVLTEEDLPGADTETKNKLVEIPETEEVAALSTEPEKPEEHKTVKPKRKKTTKRTGHVKRLVKHKKVAKKEEVLEPEEEIVAEFSSPTNTAAPIRYEPATEPRPEVTASLQNIYGNSTGASDMGTFEIKKTNRVAAFFGWLLVAGVTACAVGLFAWWYLAPNIKSAGDKVELALTVPDTVELGTTTTVTVVYTNNESVPIRNTVLQLYYPTGFVVGETSLPPTNNGKNEWLLGTIPAGEERRISISGRLYAPLNAEGTLRGLLSYRPDGFESTFQKNIPVSIIVTKSPFTLNLAAPSEGVVGVPQQYTFTINQTAPLPGSQLALELAVPETLAVTSSTIPLKDKRFSLSSKNFSTTTNSATVSFIGTWSDTPADVGTVVTGKLLLTPPGTTEGFGIATASATTTLVKNEATLSLAVNGSTKLETVQPGDVLATTLQIANNGQKTLKNGTVKLIFEGPAIGKTSSFNWAELTDKNDGTVTGEAIKTGLRRGTIVWTAKEIPALASVAPGDTVLVDVTLPIKDASSFDWATVAADSNFSVKSVADFTDEAKKNIHVESSHLTMRLRTDVAVDIRDSFDPLNPLTHLITWVVTNNLHPLKNLELTATLYGDVAFTPPTTTPAGTVTFDKKTKELRWTMENMPTGVDVLALPFTVTLAKLNPTQSQLQSKVRFKAVDTVSGDTIELFGEAIDLTNP